MRREGSDKGKHGLGGGTKQCGHWCGSVEALSPGDISLCVCVHRHSASGGHVCRCQVWGGAQAKLCMPGYIYGVARVVAWWVC